MGATFAFIVLLVAGPLQLSAVTVDWPQFGRTSAFLSFNNNSAPPSERHPEWVFTGAKNRLVASPAVAQGRVFLGSDDGHLYCLNQTTGEMLWKFKVHGINGTVPFPVGPNGDNGVRSSPAVHVQGANVTVTFGAYDGQVYHLNAITGDLLWSYQTGGPIFCPATVHVDDTSGEAVILIGSWVENCLYALKPDGLSHDVSLMWRTCGIPSNKSATGEGAMNSGPSVDVLSRTVVMNNYDGHIRGIALDTGHIRWEVFTGDKSGSSAAINPEDGTAYIGSWNELAYAIDSRTGSVRWTFNTTGSIESHLAYHDGIVFVTSESGYIYALHSNNGTQAWRFSPGAEINSSPSLTENMVLFGANDAKLWALDRKTGSFKFNFETCKNIFSSPAVADNGMVYFTCSTSTALNGQLSDAPGIGKAFALDPSRH